jgi:hypothetical protein
MTTDNVTFRDEDVVVLADSAAADGEFAFGLVIVGILLVVYGTKHELMSLQLPGVAAFAGAALLWLRRLRWRKSLVLNPAGLCVLRRRRIVEMLPADAIREVVLAELASGTLELRLRYDRNAVPILPPAIEEFRERQRGTTPVDVIVLGRVSSDPAALTLRKAFRVHRLVEDAGIAEWRRISDP